MKILFLVRRLSLGGAERQLVLLANELARRGCEVLVAAFYGGGECLEELQCDAIRFVDLEKRSVTDVVGFELRLARLLRAERPDIVHGYNRTANLAALAARVAVPRSRLIWGVRDSNMEIGNYGSAARVSEAFVSLTRHAPHAVIANSRAAAGLLRERGFHADRVRHVPNGIDARRFYEDPDSGSELRRKWGVAAAETLIGVVGRIEPMKDQRTFVHACGIVGRRRPNARFVCVGRGWGPPQYLEAVKSAAIEAGVSERLIWAAPEAEPRAVYNALDVMCSSSRYGEGFPNVIGEAMACGTPLAVTDVGDSPYVVGGCWPVAPSGDAEALAGAIEELLDSPALDEAKRRARRRILDEFSVSQLADRTLDVFEEVTATAAASGPAALSRKRV